MSRRPRPSSWRAPIRSPTPSPPSTSISARARKRRRGPSSSARATSIRCSPPVPPTSPASSTRPRVRWSDKLSQSGGELQRNLEEATSLAAERLRTQSDELVNAIATRTAQTLNAVNAASYSLSDGVSGLIDKLSTSNEQLRELIEAAAANLSGIDEKLTDTTENFAATTEKAAQSFSSSARLVDSNATRLTELSSRTFKDIAGIANRLDEHSKVLTTASDLIGSAQTNLASTLDERQKALEELSIGLVKKSEDIERIMNSFEDLVGRSLETAETRTKQSTQNIRSAITEAVEAATNRFSDATEELRQTAGSIRSELEMTRSELKKGVFELPEETRESTSAMRRAVTEQINALKELSDIVAKSGRTFDVSAPRTGGAGPRQAPRQAPPTAPRNAPAPVQPQQRRPEPVTAAPAPQAPRQPAPQRGPEAAQLQAQPPSDGWVRDLLRGASREEETQPAPREPAPQAERSPLHVVESLNSLSVDIARAIDHDASIELWDRYRHGERNVFTRRLYTLKGQQTFDEIRQQVPVRRRVPRRRGPLLPGLRKAARRCRAQ